MRVITGENHDLTKEQLHDALVERHGADIQAKLDKACVGIAGLGGLGSNLAIFLARLGVGHLILVDFDVVDITNLKPSALHDERPWHPENARAC